MQLHLFVCIVAAVISLGVSGSKAARGVENEELQRYFAELKKSGYDRNIMPEGNGRFGAVEVRCEMYLIDISEVDDLHMDYRVMMYFRQIWNDSRLAYPNQPINSIILNDPSLIWTPDLFIVQEKEGIHHSLITPNTFIQIGPDGAVRYSVRLSMTLRCPMDFTKYPHDVQKCSFGIESYGSKRDQMELSWTSNSVTFSKNISTMNFALKEVKGSINYQTLNVGDYTNLEVSLVFQRKTGFFMIRLYVPFLLLVAVSWLCFWIPAKLLALRLPLLLVVFYLMFHIGSEINARSPPVSYTKGSDVWIAVCEILVFISFLETILVHILYKKKEKNMRNNDAESHNILDMNEKMNQVKSDSSISLVASRLKYDGVVYKRIDRICAFLFPSLFVIFNLVYGFIYCCRRQQQ